MKDLIIPPSVTSVGNRICSCIKVAIPSTLDKDLFDTELTITYPVDNYLIADNCIYSSDKSTIYYASAALSGDYTIPSTVSMIGEHAYDYCKYLTSITFPNSVTTIGDYAFANCNGLTSVSLPDSLTTIGDYGFAYCDSLASIDIPDSVSDIGNATFSSCTALTSVIIPNSVTAIGNGTFSSCRG